MPNRPFRLCVIGFLASSMIFSGLRFLVPTTSSTALKSATSASTAPPEPSSTTAALEQDGTSPPSESPKRVEQPSSAPETSQPSESPKRVEHKARKATQPVGQLSPTPLVAQVPPTHRPKTVHKDHAKHVARELPTKRKPQTSKAASQYSSMSAYDKKVWTALAMHRRKPPRRGSTQVTFGIGASGELTYVRVSRSSGNSQVDQMAIATVRKSAPFPRPIGSPNDVESFTIQIGSR